MEQNWDILKQGVICFVQLDGIWDDGNYIHVLHVWFTSDRADPGHKSVFIEWYVKDPRPTTVHDLVKELVKRAGVFYTASDKFVKALKTEESTSEVCYNFRDKGTCKFGKKCRL